MSPQVIHEIVDWIGILIFITGEVYVLRSLFIILARNEELHKKTESLNLSKMHNSIHNLYAVVYFGRCFFFIGFAFAVMMRDTINLKHWAYTLISILSISFIAEYSAKRKYDQINNRMIVTEVMKS